MILWKFVCENFGLKTRREVEQYCERSKIKLSGTPVKPFHIDQELKPHTLVEITLSARVPSKLDK